MLPKPFGRRTTMLLLKDEILFIILGHLLLGLIIGYGLS